MDIKYIDKVDRNGKLLKDGDIIAEGTVGELIWDGKAVVTKRPLGILHVKKQPAPKLIMCPDEHTFYNVEQLRCGEVQLQDDVPDFLFVNAVNGKVPLYLSAWDGEFLVWDNIEMIGSIEDDFV